MKDTSKDTSSGKPTENPKGNAEAIEAESAGPSREVDLLPTEKYKLDDLDLLWRSAESEPQGSVISEEE